MRYFISGHLDLTMDEFIENYKPQIDDALNDKFIKQHTHEVFNNTLKSKFPSFIIGDAIGADLMAQKYLGDKNCKVFIYHMYDKPRNNIFNYPTIGGFKSDEERDAAMTNNSDIDLLWVRPKELQKKILGKKFKEGYITGTEKNRIRRNKQK